MEKKYIILGIVLLVVVATTGLVVWQKTTTSIPQQTATSTATTTSFFDMEPIVPEAKVSTEGWKTCRNDEYGWEVKYPEGWHVYGEGSDDGVWEGRYVVETECIGDGVFISDQSPHEKNYQIFDENTPEGSIQIRRHTGTSQGVVRSKINTIEELAELYADAGQFIGFYILNTGTTKALWSTFAPNKYNFHMFNNGQLYEITTSDRLSEKYLSTILSTFRFLDTATSSPQ